MEITNKKMATYYGLHINTIRNYKNAVDDSGKYRMYLAMKKYLEELNE